MQRAEWCLVGSGNTWRGMICPSESLQFPLEPLKEKERKNRVNKERTSSKEEKKKTLMIQFLKPLVVLYCATTHSSRRRRNDAASVTVPSVGNCNWQRKKSIKEKEGWRMITMVEQYANLANGWEIDALEKCNDIRWNVYFEGNASVEWEERTIWDNLILHGDVMECGKKKEKKWNGRMRLRRDGNMYIRYYTKTNSCRPFPIGWGRACRLSWLRWTGGQFDRGRSSHGTHQSARTYCMCDHTDEWCIQ